MSRTVIVGIYACLCFEFILISADFIYFKFCGSFEDSDSDIGTLAVKFVVLYDLSVMRECIR